jgi:type III secretion protein C
MAARPWWSIWLLLAWLGLIGARAEAAPIPWRAKNVSIVAREQPLREFLQELFAAQGLSVTVSDAVKGSVSGNFTGPPSKIFDDTVRSFALLHYFDGSIVYAYASSEAVSHVIPIPPSLVPGFVKSLDLLQMHDPRNSFQALVNEGLIIVSGAKRFVDQVAELARTVQSQAAATPAMFRVFPLKYAWAADITMTYAGRQVVVPGVATLLRSMLDAPRQEGAYLEGNEKALRPTVAKLGGKGLAAAGEPPREAKVAETRDTGPREAPAPTLPPEEFFSTGPSSRVPLGGTSARIEADRRINAIVVRDSKERMPYYEELIAALDLEPKLVQIEATIVDVNSDRVRELGINWRYKDKHADVLFGRGDQSDLRLNRDVDITPQGKGAFISTILGNAHAFISRINALSDEGAARIVSRPQVLTLSDVEAILENNKTFYVRVPGAYQVDLFNVVAGTALKVTPHVVADKGKLRIRLLVTVEDGSFTSTPQQNVDSIPVVNRSAINTQALIMEGESLLIGGLTRDEVTRNVTKVPVLGDVPLVGALFRSKRDQNVAAERMFLISPRLISLQPGGGATDATPDRPPSAPGAHRAPGPQAQRGEKSNPSPRRKFDFQE